jgi:hypothetical protein
MSEKVEIAITALTSQTTLLLDTCVGIIDSTEKRIADAVLASENETIKPMIKVATNLIDTQTLLVTLISRNTAV